MLGIECLKGPKECDAFTFEDAVEFGKTSLHSDL